MTLEEVICQYKSLRENKTPKEALSEMEKTGVPLHTVLDAFKAAAINKIPDEEPEADKEYQQLLVYRNEILTATQTKEKQR